MRDTLNLIVEPDQRFAARGGLMALIVLAPRWPE